MFSRLRMQLHLHYFILIKVSSTAAIENKYTNAGKKCTTKTSINTKPGIIVQIIRIVVQQNKIFVQIKRRQTQNRQYLYIKRK